MLAVHFPHALAIVIANFWKCQKFTIKNLVYTGVNIFGDSLIIS